MNRREPFACLSVAVIRNAALTPQARCLYMILASYANAEQVCWPSRARLAADLGLSVRTVARLLNTLEAIHLIERESSSGKRTLYRLRTPVLSSEPIPSHLIPPTRNPESLSTTAGVSKSGEVIGTESEIQDTDLLDEGHPRPPTDDTDVLHGDVTGDTDDTGSGHRCPATRDTGVSEVGTPTSHRTISKNYTNELNHRTTVATFDTAERWPTLEEFLNYAKESQIPTDDAENIWESYTNVGWVDKQRNPIHHWGAALKAASRYRTTSPQAREHHGTATDQTSTERKRSSKTSRNTYIPEITIDPNEDPRVVELFNLTCQGLHRYEEWREIH